MYYGEILVFGSRLINIGTTKKYITTKLFNKKRGKQTFL